MRKVKRYLKKRSIRRTKRTGKSTNRFNNSRAWKSLRWAYKDFVIPSVPKASINSYVDQVKIHTRVLSKDQLKEMQSA